VRRAKLYEEEDVLRSEKLFWIKDLSSFKLSAYMKKRYPRTLSSGATNTVIALSETEAGKLFTGDTRSDIGSEAEKMRFANAINGLVVRFTRLDILNDDTEMLVMERLYPMDFRAYEFEKRELWLDIFEDELTALHHAGFVHRDLRRPSDMPGERFDNIFLTPKGFRLIDVGISALKSNVGDRLFQRFVEQEMAELSLFKTFVLSR
jgi:serine/threonine protein kinase